MNELLEKNFRFLESTEKFEEGDWVASIHNGNAIKWETVCHGWVATPVLKRMAIRVMPLMIPTKRAMIWASDIADPTKVSPLKFTSVFEARTPPTNRPSLPPGYLYLSEGIGIHPDDIYYVRESKKSAPHFRMTMAAGCMVREPFLHARRHPTGSGIPILHARPNQKVWPITVGTYCDSPHVLAVDHGVPGGDKTVEVIGSVRAGKIHVAEVRERPGFTAAEIQAVINSDLNAWAERNMPNLIAKGLATIGSTMDELLLILYGMHGFEDPTKRPGTSPQPPPRYAYLKPAFTSLPGDLFWSTLCCAWLPMEVGQFWQAAKWHVIRKLPIEA